ncbi:DUF2802 domain-containing protein [Vibrio mytili]|uniref:DNA repair protein n=1 Tax=Vibrio mytili TaxID=50718 RepID=A0A0C3DH86_9VIBR|nr:DUF2802 domain-containing protein [Vibrio mytili]KIN10739.1 DNA repair protein [Vibrio mytili]
MAEQILQSLPFIAGGIAFILLVLVVVQMRSRSVLQRQLDQQRKHARNADKEVEKLTKQLLEVRSVVVGLGQKVTEQQDILKHLNERIRELEHADTDGRLYSRASKMVQLGADINELIEECELPKAEAELMLSLQKKLAGQEKVPPLSGQPTESASQTGRGRRR